MTNSEVIAKVRDAGKLVVLNSAGHNFYVFVPKAFSDEDCRRAMSDQDLGDSPDECYEQMDRATVTEVTSRAALVHSDASGKHDPESIIPWYGGEFEDWYNDIQLSVGLILRIKESVG
jgi:hypothetical protein